MDDEEAVEYAVVVNFEEQYSIWPLDEPRPPGWRAVGVTGSRARCLAHIDEVWRDVRPLSLRREGVHDLVEHQVGRDPGAPAVRDARTAESLAYQQLWDAAGVVADDLAAHGVGRGDVVAVRLGRSVDMVVAVLGIVRAGAAYLPLDAEAPAARVADVLDQARVPLVIGPGDGTAGQLTARGLRLAPATTAPRPTCSHPTEAGPQRPGRVDGEDPIYVMFTSGSTGSPKGVVVPHRAVRRLAVAPVFCSIEPGDRVANAANPAFDATTFELWNTLVAGGTVVVFPSLTDVTFTRWSQLLTDEDITTMFLTTSLFHLIARERPGALRRLRTLVVGGEQLDIAAVRRVLAAGPPQRLVNGYGPTETTTFAAYFDCTEQGLAGLDQVPVGHPLQETTLHIRDDDLRPVPPGETGELCVGGAGVALGYLGRPELTARRFLPDPVSGGILYRTGDRARTLPGGAIQLLGRVDRQVKLWGFRIELEEIESAIMATGWVEAAFVEKAGEGPDAVLVGFVLPLPGAGSSTTAGADGLRRSLPEQLSERLPAYMVPARWIVLSQVPLGPTGKVDRRQLLAQLTG